VPVESRVHMSRFVETHNGQGAQIQQVGLSESELGKRKVRDDFESVDLCLLIIECDKMKLQLQQMKIDNSQLMIKYQIDNEQKIKENSQLNEQKVKENRMSTVSTFATTMDLLNPEWRVDKSIVSQAVDYMRNAIFNEYSNVEYSDSESE